MVKKIVICVLLCMGAYHVAGGAEIEYLQVNEASPCKETNSLFSYAKEIKLYLLMSCASLHHTKNPTVDMLKLAGRRPAMTRTHCAAMLKQNHLCVLLSRAALCGARNAKK